MGIIDKFFEWVFPPNDPNKSGRELLVVSPHGRLFWLPLAEVDQDKRSEVMKMIVETYPGCRVRMAYNEPIVRVLALKLRELFGYEYRRK